MSWTCRAIGSSSLLLALAGMLERRRLQRRYAYQQGGDPEAGLGAHIQELWRAGDFPQVDREFQMIEDQRSVPVVAIRHERDREQIEQAVAQLTDPFRPCGPEVLRSLQQHTASLSKREADAALGAGRPGDGRPAAQGACRT
ncbi:hypothetical protein ABZ687_35210 [Streptomyces ardesiacus]|uniref:hypothetical protein n=1 Tax=Streptomyces ardesiacus TaxID=285564 RepID=UPI0033CD832E